MLVTVLIILVLCVIGRQSAHPGEASRHPGKRCWQTVAEEQRENGAFCRLQLFEHPQFHRNGSVYEMDNSKCNLGHLSVRSVRNIGSCHWILYRRHAFQGASAVVAKGQQVANLIQINWLHWPIKSVKKVLELPSLINPQHES